MGHVIRIQSRDQYRAVAAVLDHLPGTWHSRGPTASAVLLVEDLHYKALVAAGVVGSNGVGSNGKESKARGKKTNAKKDKP